MNNALQHEILVTCYNTAGFMLLLFRHCSLTHVAHFNVACEVVLVKYGQESVNLQNIRGNATKVPVKVVF